jgi:hypothetical protein
MKTLKFYRTAIAQSVLQLATGWKVRGSNPGGKRDFPHPSRLALGPPNPYTMGTGSFQGVMLSGRDTDHPLPTSAEVKERVKLYLYSPSGLSWLI